MGGSVSRILSLLWSKKEIRILILGLVRTTNRVISKLLDSLFIGQCWEDNTSLQVKGSVFRPRGYRMGRIVIHDCRLARSLQPYQPLASTSSR